PGASGGHSRLPGTFPGPEDGRPSPPATRADYSTRIPRRPGDGPRRADARCCVVAATIPLKALVGLTSGQFAVALDMPFWRRPACFTLEAGAVFLLAVSPVCGIV